MSVEPKWWNLREPTFGLATWLVLTAPAPMVVLGLLELFHGHETLGRVVIGAFALIWGAMLLLLELGNHAAGVRRSSSALDVGFNLYEVVVAILLMILGIGQLLRAVQPTGPSNLFFNLIRDYRGEAELVTAVIIGAPAALRWGDVRWRVPIAALGAVSAWGFFCLYLGGVRGETFRIPLEGIFWLLQIPILLTLFSSMISIESRRYWDGVATRSARPFRNPAR